MTNIAMVAMAHRNRCFTVLDIMVIFHGELLNNQMVFSIFTFWLVIVLLGTGPFEFTIAMLASY